MYVMTICIFIYGGGRNIILNILKYVCWVFSTMNLQCSDIL